MILSVKDGNWHINGEDTDIKAKEIINENEYVLPEITKVKFEGAIYYALMASAPMFWSMTKASGNFRSAKTVIG